jgi:hypothetical protein
VAGQDGGHGATVTAWIVTAVIVAAFIIGGIALIVHAWWLFWVAVAIFVVGVVAGRLTHIMDEVSEYSLPGKGQGGDPETTRGHG